MLNFIDHLSAHLEVCLSLVANYYDLMEYVLYGILNSHLLTVLWMSVVRSLMYSRDVARSLMYSRDKTGPRTDPCALHEASSFTELHHWFTSLVYTCFPFW